MTSRFPVPDIVHPQALDRLDIESMITRVSMIRRMFDEGQGRISHEGRTGATLHQIEPTFSAPCYILEVSATSDRFDIRATWPNDVMTILRTETKLENLVTPGSDHSEAIRPTIDMMRNLSLEALDAWAENLRRALSLLDDHDAGHLTSLGIWRDQVSAAVSLLLKMHARPDHGLEELVIKPPFPGDDPFVKAFSYRTGSGKPFLTKKGLRAVTGCSPTIRMLKYSARILHMSDELPRLPRTPVITHFDPIDAMRIIKERESQLFTADMLQKPYRA